MDRPSGWLNGPMLISSMRIAKIGNEITSCSQVSSDSHQTSSRGALLGGSPISVGSYSQLRMGLRWAVAGCLGFAMLAGAGCDPLTGTGPGSAGGATAYMHSAAYAPPGDVAVHLAIARRSLHV